LCEKCIAVVRAAVVLLNRGVADEATIIPTLVFAKIAGGSPGYTALDSASTPVNIPRLMHEARDRSAESAEGEYAGWDLMAVIDSVPIAHVQPLALKLEDHAGTTVLKRVEVQVISRRIKPETVMTRYERALRERGAEWSENNHGVISYGFNRGYLSMQLSSGEDLDASTVRSLGEDFFQHPTFHFPAPSLVEGIYSCLLGSADKRNRHGFAYALDLYEKPLAKSPMRLILAFVAWHVGEGYDVERPRTIIADKQHVEQFVDRQVIESLEVSPDSPWLSSRKAWEDAEMFAIDRFTRLYAMGPAPYLPKS
jgi:hypothetical protein